MPKRMAEEVVARSVRAAVDGGFDVCERQDLALKQVSGLRFLESTYSSWEQSTYGRSACSKGGLNRLRKRRQLVDWGTREESMLNEAK